MLQPFSAPCTARSAGADERMTRCSCSSIGSPPAAACSTSMRATLLWWQRCALRCGGLPLALELAAAQLTVMSLPDLLDHLAVGGDDDRVRAVLERSYALLDPDEAEVFRTFAILDGAVGLPLVRRVVSEERVPPMRVIRVLRELTAAGLMWVDRSGARWRYQMDDDVRRFASDELVAAGAQSQAFGRLAGAIRDVLPGDARTPPSGYQDEVLDMIGSVRSLLGAAIDGRADRDAGLEIAFRLHRFWAATNVAEGRFWLSRLLPTTRLQAPCPRNAPRSPESGTATPRSPSAT